MKLRYLLPLLALLTFAFASLATPATQTFPTANLRGYGKITAQVDTLPSGGALASVTRITCEDPAKAALLHAKYLSDLQGLPGLTAGKLSVNGKDFPAYEAKDQGWILAGSSGPTVFIVAGATAEAVTSTAAAAIKSLATATFAPAVPVPAYLDKWDQHGWSWYNWLWFTPNKKDFPKLVEAGYDFAKPYDYDAEYQWAAQNKTGMVYWMHEFAHDRGAGMNDYADINWVRQACGQHGLDYQIQPTLNDNMPWWANHYRAETIAKMPGYVGNYHSVNEPYMGSAGFCSWCSTAGKDELLALSQQWVKTFADDPNMSTIMEPHCEVAHGEFDLLTEYGPLADASYRKFLQQERKLSLAATGKRYGADYTSWDQVRVPELAFFLGGDKEALDLTGTWKVKYASLEDGQAQNLFVPDLDTAGWGEMVSPGHDRQMFLEKKPAWFRRAVDVPPAWLAAHQDQPIHLYLWDLNQRRANTPVVVYWNGKLVTTDVDESGIGVTVAPLAGALQPGANTLAVYLPQGYIAYRVYLAARTPVSFPRLGKEMNARWVDFRDWQTWTRVDAIRRGLEAIRAVDPNRPISLAAPDAVIDYAKELAVKYGGFFHNTGYMSAWFGDIHPRMMNSVGLPDSAEPGGPAPDLASLKSFWSLITLEGVNSYNYFIHIGSVMWDPEMKAWFESQQPMVHLLGKYHLPDTRVAGLSGIRCERLKGWPWIRDEATIPNGGYWGADVSGLLNVPADLLSERDVMNGMLSKYDLIYDEQTSIMSRELVQKISDWVKAGGTFVTLAQTGRHTEEEPDSWPINSLTGCSVQWISKVKDGGEYEWKPVELVPGQTVFDEAFWSKPNLTANGVGLKMPGDREYQRPADDKGQQPAALAANGVGLQAAAGDIKPLMRWKDDGSLAVGLRQLGKGRVFVVGLKFFNDRPWFGAPELEARLVNDILAYCGYKNDDDARVNGRLISGQTKLHDAPVGRHFISNNGLYDVYFACNQGKAAQDLTLSLPDRAAARAADRPAPWGWDVAAQQQVPLVADQGRLNVTLAGMEPMDLRAVLVPRRQIAQAPAEWLKLQTGWWQGGDAPGKVLTPDRYDYVQNLTDGWTLTPVTDDTFTAVAGPALPNVSLGPWTYLLKQPVKNAVFSRDFTVPAAWTDGNVWLHVTGWVGPTFIDQGRVVLDNQEVRRLQQRGRGVAAQRPAQARQQAHAGSADQGRTLRPRPARQLLAGVRAPPGGGAAARRAVGAQPRCPHPHRARATPRRVHRPHGPRDRHHPGRVEGPVGDAPRRQRHRPGAALRHHQRQALPPPPSHLRPATRPEPHAVPEVRRAQRDRDRG